MFTSTLLSQFAKGNSNNFLKQSKKYFALNEKAIKMKIKSISSIEKITKAMKMVKQNFLNFLKQSFQYLNFNKILT